MIEVIMPGWTVMLTFDSALNPPKERVTSEIFKVVICAAVSSEMHIRAALRLLHC